MICACLPASLPACLPAAPGSFRFSSFLLALLLYCTTTRGTLLYFHLQPTVQEAALVFIYYMYTHMSVSVDKNTVRV
jgi:hypothetical protein